MAYENETKETIQQRMLDASPSDIDKRPGSVTYDLTGPAAIEFETAYIELDTVLDKGLAVKADGTASAFGEYLDRRVAEMGLIRKPSEKAIGHVTFSGTDGTLIPKGSEVSTDGEYPIYFVTTADATITGGTVSVAAEAKVGGANGNVSVGAIKLTAGNITGITAVTNASMFDGGVDTESDADLLARYLDRVRRPATSGNGNHYRQWALEIAGISDAKVYSVWNGNGTVKVVLLDSDKTAPDSTKIAEVAAYIETQRPVGATVSVVGATEVSINVSVTVTLASGASLADAQAQITKGLREYLKTLAFVDPMVRYTQIANVVLNADAVVDYANLQVNGAAGNITIADGSVAVVGTVSVT